MKKYFLLVIAITMLVSGCSKINETNAVQELPIELGEYYKDSKLKSGFSYNDEPSLYETYWVLNILDYLDSEIPNKNSVLDFINNIEISEIIEDEETRNYSEDQLLHIISIKKILNDEIDKDNLQYIKSFIKDSKQVVSLSGNEKANTSLIKLNNLINEPLDDFKHESLLNLAIDENEIYYAYLYKLLGNEINESDVELFNNFDISELNDFTLNNLYYYKFISNKNTHRIKSKDATLLINNYINNSNAINTQTLYQYIYVFENDITKEDKDLLINFLLGMMVKGGWKNPSSTIDIITTEKGLSIAGYYNLLDSINMLGIENYLSNVFDAIMDDWDYYYIYYPNLVNSYKEIGNKEKLNELIQFTIYSLEHELDKPELNIDKIMMLIEISLLLDIENNIKPIIKEHQQAIYNYIKEINKDENKYFYNYFITLFNRMFDRASTAEIIYEEFNYYSIGDIEKIYIALLTNYIGSSAVYDIQEYELRGFLENKLIHSDNLETTYFIIKCLYYLNTQKNTTKNHLTLLNFNEIKFPIMNGYAFTWAG